MVVQSNWNSFVWKQQQKQKIMENMFWIFFFLFFSYNNEQSTDCLSWYVSHLYFRVSRATADYTPHKRRKNLYYVCNWRASAGAPIGRLWVSCWFSVKCAPTIRVWQTVDAICSIIMQIVTLKLLLNDSVTPKLMKSQWYARTVIYVPTTDLFQSVCRTA